MTADLPVRCALCALSRLVPPKSWVKCKTMSGAFEYRCNPCEQAARQLREVKFPVTVETVAQARRENAERRQR